MAAPKVTLKAVEEIPEVAKASRGRTAAPTQFDDSPLKVGVPYEIPGLTSDQEKELLAELRRWADKQPGQKLSVRLVGRNPFAAIGNEKRTVYVEAYHPATRGPRQPK